MTVWEDHVTRRDGTPGIFGVVEKPDFAVIAAVDNGEIYLVEQYRYPVRGRYWEMPQGSLEVNDVDPLAVAAAELRQETGLNAESMVHIGHLFLAYGYSSQGYDVYFATRLRQASPETEPEEDGLIPRPFCLASLRFDSRGSVACSGSRAELP